MKLEKVNIDYKDYPSVSVVEDHHHHSELKTDLTIENIGGEKPILLLNTDKHKTVRIVTPDGEIWLYAYKLKDGTRRLDVRVIPSLVKNADREDFRRTLLLSSFDDQREAQLRCEGQRYEDWSTWLDETKY